MIVCLIIFININTKIIYISILTKELESFEIYTFSVLSFLEGEMIYCCFLRKETSHLKSKYLN